MNAVVQVASPLPLRATAPQPEIVVPPSAKSTVPDVTAEPELVTPAVRVVELLGDEVNEGFWLEERAVLVAARVAAVARLRDHPPSIPAPAPPPSPSAFSVTYRLHVPFGLVPPKVEVKVAVPVGAAFEKLDGAGEGNSSLVAPFPKSLMKSAGLMSTEPVSPEVLLVHGRSSGVVRE